MKRDFRADGPNRAWFADITYVRTQQGWLYLAVVMDVLSRMVAGWAMGPRMTAELADDALKMAIARRGPERGCLHHSASTEAKTSHRPERRPRAIRTMARKEEKRVMRNKKARTTREAYAPFAIMRFASTSIIESTAPSAGI